MTFARIKIKRTIMDRKRIMTWAVALGFALSAAAGNTAQVRQITLDEAILLARTQSVDAAVALNELKTAYWEYRTYKADLLPEVNLSAIAPSYNKAYNSYQQENGAYTFVRNNYMQMNGQLSIDQNIWLTGGTLSLNTSLDFMRQLDGDKDARFMSVPIALPLNHPICGVNHLKWTRRIEPVRYAEAKADFLSATEEVTMTTINYFFNLLLAKENVGIAKQNLENARKLYEVAKAKGNMRQITLFAQVGFTGTDRTFEGAYHPLKDNQVVEVGFKIPILDWGKRRGQVKVAQSNREVTESRLRQETMNFNQNLFILVEQFNNQGAQLDIANEADAIAQKRYHTNVETFMIGKISTLDLNDAQVSKDEARQKHISELFYYWYYYYQLLSLTLWDFEKNTNIDADFEEIVKK